VRLALALATRARTGFGDGNGRQDEGGGVSEDRSRGKERMQALRGVAKGWGLGMVLISRAGNGHLRKEVQLLRSGAGTA